ncbi:hypothetical protein BDDG_02745 [Blastomyces dermatitidis ATCC 18188]|uniref:Uncharacterized protein n=1 Tax=Ajellomyces dermatitidis (strain ATCC 18188 / CBS 674.68) TaxID=653446 RepID=F2T991_AJEDA|nr:hypothetical protein BDDG_02745 [Blastomyces dermatitidis ATCC 18188]
MELDLATMNQDIDDIAATSKQAWLSWQSWDRGSASWTVIGGLCDEVSTFVAALVDLISASSLATTKLALRLSNLINFSLDVDVLYRYSCCKTPSHPHQLLFGNETSGLNSSKTKRRAFGTSTNQGMVP